MSYLNVQYGFISCGTSFMLFGHPLMMSSASCYGCLSLPVACCISYIVLQFGMYVTVSIALMSIFIPGTLSSLFSCGFVLTHSLL